MNEKYNEISGVLKGSSAIQDAEVRAAITTLNKAYFREDINAFNESLEQVRKLSRTQGSLYE